MPVFSVDDFLFGHDLMDDPDQKSYFDKESNSLHLFKCQKKSVHPVCPYCGEEATRTNGWERRTCQLFPIHGFSVFLHIRQRRFKCANPHCSHYTFTLETPGFKVYQHRSDSLNIALFALSIFFSDTALSLLSRQFGLQVSRESIRNLLSHVEIKDEPDIDAIGVDDVCLKKGQTYYTVIYDAHDHHLLALLQGRDGRELTEWLKKHPKIKVVARDRASAYASAISKVLPDCAQVADRFHLLDNLLEYLHKMIQNEVPGTIFVEEDKILDHEPKKEWLPIRYDPALLDSLHYDDTPPVDENGKKILFIDKSASRNQKQYQRQAESRKKKYQKVKATRQAYFNKERPKKKDLQERFRISNATLDKYLSMSEEEVEKLLEITPYKKRDTPVNPYLNRIYKMLKDNVDPPLIFAYILHQGYQGSQISLENHIKAIKENNFGGKVSKVWNVEKHYSETIDTIKSNAILRYVTIKDREKMKYTKVAVYYSKIKIKYPIVEECENIWNEFYKILMGNDPNKIDEFIKKEKETKIHKFVEGLKKDIAAIKHAISSAISSGFVEGGNDRYKLVKRTMFGRAGQKRLFDKTYAISIIMRTGIKASELIEKWIHEDGRIKKEMPVF